MSHIPPGYELRTFYRRAEPELFESVAKVRYDVWSAEGSPPSDGSESQWSDAVDEIATHWAVLHEGATVAAARVSVHLLLEDIPDYDYFTDLSLDLPLPIASLNRLVVHPDHRRLGISRLLDIVRIDHSRLVGARTAFVAGTDARLKPLQELGFRCIASRHGIRFPHLMWHVMAVTLCQSEAEVG